MWCKCSNCGFNYKTNSSMAVLMVLTGGARCPLCRKEDGICIVVGARKG